MRRHGLVSVLVIPSAICGASCGGEVVLGMGVEDGGGTAPGAVSTGQANEKPQNPVAPGQADEEPVDAAAPAQPDAEPEDARAESPSGVDPNLRIEDLTDAEANQLCAWISETSDGFIPSYIDAAAEMQEGCAGSSSFGCGPT